MSRTRSEATIARFQFDRANWSGGNPVTEYLEMFSTSVIEDDVHPGWRNSTGVDSGGPMKLRSDTWSFSPGTVHRRSPGHSEYLNGPIVPLGPDSWYETLPGIGDPSDLSLIGLGTTAIHRTTPTRPSASLAVTLGEIMHDGLPALVGLTALKSAAKSLRSTGKRSYTKNTKLGNPGSEFLNVEFGWLPLVNDLRKLARSVKSANKVTNQYRKSSDSKIRRRYFFPSEDATLELKMPGNGGSYMTSFPGPVTLNVFPSGATTYRVSNRTWFSGAFVYHIPLGVDLPSKMVRWESEANKLLGSRLTPEVVWDLAPWSWALDWFGNYGDVLANISNLGSDGLVLQYGYIMNEHIFSTQNVMSVPFPGRWYDAPEETIYGSSSHRVKTARRFPATPFGFNFDMTSLSATQDAVVVALGLSRGHR